MNGIYTQNINPPFKKNHTVINLINTRNSLLVLVALVFPFLLLSYFAFPGAFDDFNNATLSTEKGEVQYVIDLFNNWTGRFSSSAILAFANPMKSKNWLFLYKLFPVITICLLIYSCFFFIKSLVSKNFSFIEALLIALLFVLVFLNNQPAVSELFYWFTGAGVYTSGLILFLFLGGSCINYIKSPGLIQKIFWAISSFVFIVLVIGVNESILLGVLFTNFFLICCLFLYNGKNKLYFIFLFLTGILAAYFSLTAPGNSVRAEFVHGSESILTFAKVLKSIIHSLHISIVKIFSWLNNFTLVLFSFILIPVFLKALKRSDLIKTISSVNPLLLCIFTVLLVAVQAFPSFVGVNDVDTRVWASIYFLFLIAWVFTLLSITRYFKEYLIKIPNLSISYAKIALVLFLIFSLDGNLNRAFTDLLFKAPAYKANLDKRYTFISNSIGEHVIVPPIFEQEYKYPKSIFAYDITTNPDDFRNKSIAKFFKLKSIKLEKEPRR